MRLWAGVLWHRSTPKPPAINQQLFSVKKDMFNDEQYITKHWLGCRDRVVVLMSDDVWYLGYMESILENYRNTGMVVN